jgi:hypothetical protein
VKAHHAHLSDFERDFWLRYRHVQRAVQLLYSFEVTAALGDMLFISSAMRLWYSSNSFETRKPERSEESSPGSGVIDDAFGDQGF